MKTTLYYSEKMTLCVHALGMVANVDMGCKELREVLDYVQAIFDDKTMFLSDAVDVVYVINSETGELIAECEPDQPQDNEVWPTADEIFEDWGYNEDEGFDPYEGCYSYDC